MDVIFLKGSFKMLNEHCLLQVFSSESKYLKQKKPESVDYDNEIARILS